MTFRRYISASHSPRAVSGDRGFSIPPHVTNVVVTLRCGFSESREAPLGVVDRQPACGVRTGDVLLKPALVSLPCPEFRNVPVAADPNERTTAVLL